MQLQDCCLTAGIENGCAELLSVRYASRNGIPLEVVSKVVLRHRDLKTTQIDLDLIGISAGFDNHEMDWGGTLRTDDYGEIGRLVRSAA